MIDLVQPVPLELPEDVSLTKPSSWRTIEGAKGACERTGVKFSQIIQGELHLNCHAYALRLDRWISADWDWVEAYGIECAWPKDVERSHHVSAWRKVLARLGCCEIPRLLPFSDSFDQIAFFACSRGYITHSARLLGEGDNWGSKMGRHVIVEGHRLNDCCDASYHGPKYFFRREVK